MPKQKQRKFTEYELDYIRKWFPSKGGRYVAGVLGRSPGTIYKKAAALGVVSTFVSRFNVKLYDVDPTKIREIYKLPDRAKAKAIKAYAEDLGCSKQHLYQCALGLGLGKKRKPKKNRRICLKCDKPFMSEGIYNRVCHACRESNEVIRDPESMAVLNKGTKRGN